MKRKIKTTRMRISDGAQYYTTLFMFVLGAGLGLLSLALWNYLTRGMRISFLSAFAPEGGQVYVAGFRLKHWMVGLGLILAGGLTLNRSVVGAFFIGFGLALFLDEFLTGDLW